MYTKFFITISFIFLSYSLTAQNFRKMKSIQTEIIINAPKVWEVLTNFKDYSSWNSFIVSIEGEPKEGTRLKNTLVLNGKKNVFKPKILKVVPNEHFEWLGKGALGTFKGQHYFKLESLENNQTKLIHGEHFSGWLRGMIMKKIGKATQESFIKMNQELKKQAES